MQNTKSPVVINRNASAEIWYVSFENRSDKGSGLSTYMREVTSAALEARRPICVFEINRHGQAHEKPVDCEWVKSVAVSDQFGDYMSPLGYWMNLSFNMAEAVLNEISKHGRPKAIEVADGFGIGYFLLQHKLTGHPALDGVAILMLAHTPIKVIEVWNDKEVYSLPNWWTYRAEKWCYHAADAVITLSDVLENVLIKEGYILPDQKVYRAANPYSGQKPAALKALSGDVTTTLYVVGMASRMVDWKGLREALLLAREAKISGIDLTVELCGHKSADFDVALKDFSDVFESKHAVYLGVLGDKELSQRRTNWVAQIHPSKFDNFPYSVIESLMQGLPCLINKENGISEVLPGRISDQLVVDFSEPATVLQRIKNHEAIKHEITKAELKVFSSDTYFKRRDEIFSDLEKRNSTRTKFPFVDWADAKAGLRPKSPVAPSLTGARITVVIPYYNMGLYIDECVESVLRSTIPADIIIVNDGSRDKASITKLDEFRDIRNIRVLDIPNGGVARARNYGVSHVMTEYVALLDADDTVVDTYYEKSLNILDQYDNVGFVGSWCNDYKDENGATIRYWPTYNAEPLPNIFINNTNCQSLIYRTNLFMESGQHDPDLRMYLDDWDGMLGMLEGGYFGVMLPGPYFNYRQRRGSIFSTGRGLWGVNYAKIVHKRRSLYEKNAAEVILFANANGANQSFHLLGWPTHLNNVDYSSSASPKRRMKMFHRFARSLAKRLNRFSEKGYKS